MTYTDYVKPYAPYDKVWSQAANSAEQLLRDIGVDAQASQHTLMTPYRLAHYLSYWTRPLDDIRFTVFDNDNGIDQMIAVGPIDFWAVCSHHMLPFFGKVWFGYIPDKKIVGLSMVPLLVKSHCARPWLQEDMTQGLANVFQEKLEPLGLGVYCEAIHTCQMLDLGGPPVPMMKKQVLYGAMREDGPARAEFRGIINGG